jgi:hypothetical protein
MLFLATLLPCAAHAQTQSGSQDSLKEDKKVEKQRQREQRRRDHDIDRQTEKQKGDQLRANPTPHHNPPHHNLPRHKPAKPPRQGDQLR